MNLPRISASDHPPTEPPPNAGSTDFFQRASHTLHKQLEEVESALEAEPNLADEDSAHARHLIRTLKSVPISSDSELADVAQQLHRAAFEFYLSFPECRDGPLANALILADLTAETYMDQVGLQGGLEQRKAFPEETEAIPSAVDGHAASGFAIRFQ